jgi:hypothetical protein
VDALIREGYSRRQPARATVRWTVRSGCVPACPAVGSRGRTWTSPARKVRGDLCPDALRSLRMRCRVRGGPPDELAAVPFRRCKQHREHGHHRVNPMNVASTWVPYREVADREAATLERTGSQTGSGHATSCEVGQKDVGSIDVHLLNGALKGSARLGRQWSSPTTRSVAKVDE